MLLSVVAVAVFWTAAVRADETSAAAAAAAEKAAAGEELSPEAISKLVKQLDANSFAQRQEASKKLFAAGSSAIPALEKAAQGDSREVTTRSIDILKKHVDKGDDETKAAAKAALEALAKCETPAVARRAQEALKPKPKPGDVAPGQGLPIMPGLPPQVQRQIQIQVMGGAGVKRVNARNVNGVKDIDVKENGRKIKIHDDPNQGITVEVTEKKDGKDKTSKYEAKNADELKKKHPEAYKIYKEYAEGQGGQIQIQMPPMRIQGMPGGPIPFKIRPPALPGMFPQPQDDRQKKAAEKIEQTRQQLKDLAEQLKKQLGDDEKAQEKLKRLEEIQRQLDEVKEKLED